MRVAVLQQDMRRRSWLKYADLIPLYFSWIKNTCRLNTILLMAATVIYSMLLASFSQQPAGSHPDEYGKINQIVSGKRNWNYPQLLLTNLQIAQSFYPRAKKPALVMIGRYISNIYAAITVLLFAIIGWRLFGKVGAWLFFGAFAGNSAIMVSGRYVKEDIFVLFSIAVLSLALTFDRTDINNVRDLRLAALIGGLGCAFAISSKYIGIVFAVVFLFVHFYQRRSEWRANLLELALSFLVATLVINYDLLLEITSFLSGFEGEFEHATSTHDGIWFGELSNIYLHIIRQVIALAVLIAIPVFIALLRMTGCRRSVVGLLIFSLASIFAYAAMIQSAPIKIPRYAFPLLVLLPLAFLIAAGELWRGTRTSWIRLLVVVPVMFFIYHVAWSSMTIAKEIKYDTRDQLFRYVTTSLQYKNALILTDSVFPFI